ncbi:acetyltransferase [Neoroseomonas lacus]|uniref:Acetyltransferase n=1 Tax=Neoroseomonas lacus TaxID=287609 RepID=A0A917K5H4_9PROT|nr:acetyltransferase [Neoroseomonas lacus]
MATLPEGLPDLARIAAAEGFRMLDVLARDWADGSNRFTATGEALFAAHDGAGRLLGMGGITRDPWVEALRMRRFYVRPVARGDGVGRALAEAALDHARASEITMVRLRAPAVAFAFWEALGFVRLPGDPVATHALTLRHV